MLQDEFFKHMKTGNKNFAGGQSEVEISEEESSDDEPEEQASRRPVIPDSDTSSSGSSDESSEEESSGEEDEDEEKAAKSESKEDMEMKDTMVEEPIAAEQVTPAEQPVQAKASAIPGLNLL